MTPEQLDDLSIRIALAAGAKKDKGHLYLHGKRVAYFCCFHHGYTRGQDYATSRDAFYRDIVPEIKRRGKWGAFTEELLRLKHSYAFKSDSELINYLLDLEPHELCKAAIKVLEEAK